MVLLFVVCIFCISMPFRFSTSGKFYQYRCNAIRAHSTQGGMKFIYTKSPIFPCLGAQSISPHPKYNKMRKTHTLQNMMWQWYLLCTLSNIFWGICESIKAEYKTLVRWNLPQVGNHCFTWLKQFFFLFYKTEQLIHF